MKFLNYKFLLLALLPLIFITNWAGFTQITKEFQRNLLVYFDFNQTQGSILEDHSDKGNNGDISNASQFWNDGGVQKGCASFNEGVKVILNSNRRLSKGDELTLMMWVKPEHLKGKVKFLSTRSYEAEFNYYMLGMDNGMPYAALGDGTNFAATPKNKVLIPGQWNHLAMTVSGNQKLKLYVDGVLTETVPTDSPGFNTLNSNISLGSDFQGSEAFYIGQIDEFIILNKALDHIAIKNEVKRFDALKFRMVTPEMIMKDPVSFLSLDLPMNEGRGKTVKNKRNASYSGLLSSDMESQWQEEFINYSLFFKKKQDRVIVESHSAVESQNSFSVLCWIKPQRSEDEMVIISKLLKSQKIKGFSLRVKKGALIGEIANDLKNSVITKKDIIIADTWQQAGLILDRAGKKLKLVYNGAVVESKDVDFSPLTGNAPFIIGGGEGFPAGYRGYISSLVFYQISVPDALCKKDFGNVRAELQKAEKERKEKAVVREELKKNFSELNILNELLEEKDTVEDVLGSEIKTLERLKKLILVKVEKAQKRKQSELRKFGELTEKIKKSQTQLNDYLKRLGQAPFSVRMPELNPASADIKDILKSIRELKRSEVEIGLLIKQKAQELELKESLQAKKKARQKERGESLVKKINLLHPVLGLPSFSVDVKKMESDTDQYLQELEKILTDAERKTSDKKASIMDQVQKERESLILLYSRMKELGLALKEKVPEEVDLKSSILRNNVFQLTQMLDNLKKKNEEWKEWTKRMEAGEAQKIILIRKSVSEELKAVQKLKLEVESLCSKLGQPQFPDNPLLKKDINSIRKLNEITEYEVLLAEYKKQQEEFQSRLLKINEEHTKKLLSNETEQLKNEFKKLKNKLLLVNSELNIKEKYELIPVPETGDKASEMQSEDYPFDQVLLKNVKSTSGKTTLIFNNFLENSYVAGKFKKALAFNGMDTYVQMDLNGFLGKDYSFSVSLWFFINRIWSERALLDLSSESEGRIQIVIRDSDLFVLAGKKRDDLKKINNPFKASAKEWHHMAITYDQSKRRLSFYLNGKASGGLENFSFSLKSRGLILGCIEGIKSFFSGSLDEFRIFSRALNESEIKVFLKSPEEGLTASAQIQDPGKLSAYLSALKKQVAQMNKALSEREVLLENKRKKEEEARKNTLVRIDKILAELNECLRYLGFPEYPLQKPKKGQEDVLLQKFEAELGERKIQVNQAREEQLKKTEQNKKIWEALKEETDLFMRRLKKPVPNLTFTPEKALQDIDSFNKQIEYLKKEYHTLSETERKKFELQYAKAKEDNVSEVNTLTSRVHEMQKEIQQLSANLNQPYKPLDPFPWLEPLYQNLWAYYSFNRNGSYLFPDNFKGEILEFNSLSGPVFKEGRFGQGIFFDGIRDFAFVSLKGIEESQKTVVFWFKPEVNFQKAVLAGLFDNQRKDSSVSLYIDKSGLCFEFIVSGNKVTFDTGVSVNIGEWQHIAFSLNGKKKVVTLYYNGKKSFTKLVSDLPAVHSSLFLGTLNEKNYFKGMMDDLKIFNKGGQDELLASGIKDLTYANMESRKNYLQDLIQKQNMLLDQKRAEKTVLEKQQKLKEEEQKGIFLENLRKLNEFHRLLKEPEETGNDFEKITGDKNSILQTRLKRIEERYAQYLKEEENKRLEILKTIDSERKRLTGLYQNLNQTGELYLNVQKGKENEVLKVMRAKIAEKELEYGNKLKDLEQRRTYLNNELKTIYSEIQALASKMNTPPPAVPELVKGQEERIMADQRNVLNAWREKFSQWEEMKRKEFADLSGRIEKLWEKIETMLGELNQHLAKPAYQAENASKVLNELESLFQKKQKELTSYREKAKMRYDENKKQLEALLSELKNVTDGLKEPLNFIPDYQEKNIQISVDQCSQLLARKKEELAMFLESQHQQMRKEVRELTYQISSAVADLNEFNKSLKIKKEYTVPMILDNSPASPFAFFPFNKAFKNSTWDSSLQICMRLSDIEIIPVTEKDFSSALTFNGMSSYAGLLFPKNRISQNPLTIMFHMKINHFSDKSLILSLKGESETSFELRQEKNKIKICQTEKMAELVFAEEVLSQAHKWFQMILMTDWVNGKVNLFLDGRPFLSLNLFKPMKFRGEMHLGSADTKKAFFSGSIAELRMYDFLFKPDDFSVYMKSWEPVYNEDAKQLLMQYFSVLSGELKDKEIQVEKNKQAEIMKRQSVLKEIDNLKSQLALYTRQTKIHYSVVIGEEESALIKLREKVNQAKIVYDRKRAAEEEALKKLKDDISKVKNSLGILSAQTGKSLALPEMKAGNERQYLKELNLQQSALTNAKLEMEFQIKQLREKLKQNYLQMGDPALRVREIGQQETMEHYIQSMKSEIDKTSNRIKKKKQTEMILTWENKYKILSGILKEQEKEIPVLTVPQMEKVEAALSEMDEKIREARETLKAYENKKELENRNLRNEFDAVWGQLNSILKELNQENTVNIAFDNNQPKESLAALKSIAEQKKLALQEQRKTEEERLKALKETAEGLPLLIDEEKKRIRQYVKDLNLSSYKMPTVLSSEKKIKGLGQYFKFDQLKEGKLNDETGNSSNSFIPNYSDECKVVGKYGFASQLNGLDQFIHLSLSEEILKSSSLTICFWVNALRTYGKRDLFTSYNEINKKGCILFIEDGFLKFQAKVGQETIEIKNPSEFLKKTWIHIALRCEEKGLFELFMNGEKVGAINLKQPFRQFVSGNIILGSDFNQSLDLFAGIYDELKIYTVALEQTQIKKTMQEEVLTSEVDDVELLKEEYAVLQEESGKLNEQLAGLMQRMEDERLKKIDQIQQLKDEILDLNKKMGYGSFSYSFQSGKESTALMELTKLREEKLKEYQEYEKQQGLRLTKMKDEALNLEKQIQEFQIKMGVEHLFRMDLKAGAEEEILDKGRTFLKQVKSDYELYLKNQTEADRLEKRKFINDLLAEINSKLQKLNEPVMELPLIQDGEEPEVLSQLKQKENEVNVLIRKMHDKEKQAKEKIEKGVLLKNYRLLARETESILKALSLEDEGPVEKRDDPTAKIYLDFDDGKGNLAKDRSQYGNMGNFLDFNYEWSESGVYNKSVVFNGTAKGMVIHETPSLNEIENFSILFWVNPSRLNDMRSILSLGEVNSSKFEVQTQEDKVILSFGKDFLIDTGITLENNLWQHIAFVFDKDKKMITFYMDGSLVNQIEYPEDFSGSSVFLNTPLYLASAGDRQGYAGMMDDFKLFSKLLSQDEVVENQKQGIPKVESDMEILTVSDIKARVAKLEEKLADLRLKKIQADQREKAKKARQQQENKILKIAERTKNEKIYAEICQDINRMLKIRGEPTQTFPELPDENPKEIISKLDIQRLQILKNLNGEGEPLSMSVSSEDGQQGDVFCRIDFEEFNGRSLKDKCPANQDVEYGASVKEWILKDGVAGNALKFSEQAYIKIKNNYKAAYQSKTSYQLWIYPDPSTLVYSPLLIRGGFKVEIRDSRLRAVIGEELLTYEALGQLQANQWQLIQILVDEFSSKVEMNISNRVTQLKTYQSKIINPQDTLYIGGGPDEARFFKGYMDEITVFHRLLNKKDLELPVIYNCKLQGQFVGADYKYALVNLQAQNADWMKIYQAEKGQDCRWEPYHSNSLTQLFNPGNSASFLTLIAELKNKHSDNIKKITVDLPLPEERNVKFILPPDKSEVTSR